MRPSSFSIPFFITFIAFLLFVIENVKTTEVRKLKCGNAKNGKGSSNDDCIKVSKTKKSKNTKSTSKDMKGSDVISSYKPKKKSKNSSTKSSNAIDEDDAVVKDDANVLHLRVMTYNVWGGGGNENKPINETVNAILAANNIDIIGMQETRLESDPCTETDCPAVGSSVAKDIAEALGYYYYDQTTTNVALWANAVISRYPILNSTKNDLGVAIDIGNNIIVYAYNIHLTDFPYQPYQLLNISYGPAPFIDTKAEAIAAAQMARGPALELLYEDLKESQNAVASFIFGDFNEPSHRDWNTAAANAGLQPLRVRFPTTAAIERQGYMDAFRTYYPNVIQKPGFTWTPTTSIDDPDDHHDRIDFVFVRSNNDIDIINASIVGELNSTISDIKVPIWPSDHRAVAATIQIKY